VGKRDFAPGGTFFWGADGGGEWWQNCFVGNLDYFRDENTWSVARQTGSGPLNEINLDAYFARPHNGGHNVQTQTRYIQDASYIRLKNLQIGYTLPTRLTQKISIEQVRVFFSAENIWTYSPIYGVFDPETAFGNANGSMRGNVYPLSKVFSFGLNINF
jgi:hypothetical protein